MPKESNRPAPPPVAPELWQPLYDAAARFRALEPWKDLYDRDFVGIVDPQTQVFLLASVLGNLGEVYALALYREREGIEFCRRALELEEGEALDAHELGFQQNLMMAEFVGKRALNQVDREVLNSVNWPVFKGRGGPKHVNFRSYRPHYFPWHIDSEEARLLTLGLDRFVAYYQWRTGGNLCLPATPEAIPIYKRLHQSTDPDGGWKLVTGPLPVFPEPAEETDLNQLEQICQRVQAAEFARDGIWELRVRPEQLPIMEGDRPFYPSMGLVAHAASGFVLGAEFMRPIGTETRRAAELLLKTIERTAMLPGALHVEARNDGGALQGVCDLLRIPLKTQYRLPALEMASQSLTSFLDRGRR
jgi:hypothetical protein